MSVKTFHSFYCGRNLLETVEEGKAYLKTMTQMKSELITLRMRLYLQVLSNITNPNYDGKIFDGEFYEEAILFPQQVKFQDTSGVHSFYLFKAITYFLMGEYEMADKYLKKLRENHEVFANLFHFPMHKFYDNINSLYLFEAGKTVALKFIRKNVLQFEKWGKQTPMNHQHHAYLLKAAYHQMDKNFKDAQHYYDKAINAAQRNNFLGIEALASEMAGTFHLKYGFIHMAQLYLKNAYLLYQKWGASAKSNQILKKHPNFFNTTINLKIRDINKKSALNFQTNQQESLDLSSIIKASQTISGAIILSDLLKKMMDIIIENVGAQNGYLLLNRKQKWTIEAVGNIQTFNQQKQDSFILESTPLEKQREIFGQQLLSEAVIQFVGRTKKELVLIDAATDERFITDGFIRKKKIKSLLCFPVINKGQISGLLYLENNLVAGAFTSKRLKVLRLLSAQIAISIENAMLYQRLEKQNKELKLLNKELVTQNQDLQQFAYITSHNLREPASTILGLAKLFDKQNLANPINTQIIDNLEKSALNMNTIIKDLNYILSIKKDAEDARELIDLKVLTISIKQSLAKQMQASGAIIAYDFSKVAPIYSLKGYWHSIFYNLISNAIKYRSEKRKPIINIQSETVKDLIIISFSDNGIGIDLEKYRENLFGMYKRFHVHKEGKG